MCGIHFTINAGTNNRNLDDFMENAFYANQVRGTDSSGIFSVGHLIGPRKPGARQVDFFKKAENGSEFLKYTGASDLVKKANSAKLTVGHVRAATFGAPVDENSHPFIAVREDDSKIIGVHNGSLDGWHGKIGADKCRVDSQWLYNRIAEDGIDAFEGINGAFALVWYDSLEPNKVFIARNDKRPLFFAYTEDEKGIIGCSELGMLGWLADRNDIKLHADKEGFRFHFPEAGNVLTIDLDDPRKVEKIPFKAFNTAFTKYNKPYTPAAPANPTNAAPAGGTSGAAQMTPYRSNLHPSQRGRDDGDDDIWEGANKARQESFLRKVKDAIAATRVDRTPLSAKQRKRLAKQERRARNKGVASQMVTQEFLDNQLEQEINRIQHERSERGEYDDNDDVYDSVGPGLEFVSEPAAHLATKEEQQRARNFGLFGAVVKFVGYFWDEPLCEVNGDFSYRDPKNQVTRYDALIRGCTSKAADARYINPTKSTPMVVIGITGDTKPFMILADKPAYASTYHSPPAMNSVGGDLGQSIGRMLH